MPLKRKNLLCRYSYDPLDRLVGCTPTALVVSQRFYLKDRLSTEIQGSARRSIFQQGDLVLAQQQQQDDAVKTTLLTTDQQRSVLHAFDTSQPHILAYMPYGHRALKQGLLSLLGFNGERPEPVTGHYLLGNGYRAFNPVLMRFNSPDTMSPFGKGGLNAYAYCQGDPINRADPNGHTFINSLLALAGLRTASDTVRIHGIKLKVPANVPLENFMKYPTKPYKNSNIEIPPELINGENFLIQSSKTLIEQEKRITALAAMMSKHKNVRPELIDLYQNLITQVNRDRAMHQQNLITFDEILNAPHTGPSHLEIPGTPTFEIRGVLDSPPAYASLDPTRPPLYEEVVSIRRQ
ncbi:hypothetical protein PHLH5_50130 [Pseudomonas sp. Cab53]|uniref:RHS repeat-associated core domain-containing protein n=1 Tax=unclassified Pseudomonas TaxID=196821 RepID=UPI0009BA86FB|nr:RHS repeat-associated core domain-containing protein [Pseudomonas sp. Cab53]BBP67472.1 hypothetical protein PHLH5_50130 [Pseudomonas sp. Cab53]